MPSNPNQNKSTILPAATIRADFDQLAELSSQNGWDHNSHYHRFLLRHMPQHCGDALEIGCGTGAFARKLAARADRVLALDLSPNMIRIARERSQGVANIDFEVADALVWTYAAAQYDCVASLATLHHLPLADMLSRMHAALKPGGVLVVLDLVRSSGGTWDALIDIGAVLAHWTLTLTRTNWLRKRLKPGRKTGAERARRASAEHAAHDFPLTLPEVRQICDRELPGAHVRRHLLWRYSIVWHKPLCKGT